MNTKHIEFLDSPVIVNPCSPAACINVLVVGEIKSGGMSLKPVVVGCDSAHKEAHGLGGVASAPFLAGFF